MLKRSLLAMLLAGSLAACERRSCLSPFSDYYQVLKRFVALLEDGDTSVWLNAPAGQSESYPWVLAENVQGHVLVAEYAVEVHGPYTFSSTKHDQMSAAALTSHGRANQRRSRSASGRLACAGDRATCRLRSQTDAQ